MSHIRIDGATVLTRKPDSKVTGNALGGALLLAAAAAIRVVVLVFAILLLEMGNQESTPCMRCKNQMEIKYAILTSCVPLLTKLCFDMALSIKVP